MLFLSLLVIILVTWLGFFIKRERNNFRMYKQFRAEPWNIPVFGYSYLFFFNTEIARMNAVKRFGRFALKQGGLSSLWLGPKYFLMVVDPNVTELVLKRFLEKDDIMQSTQELLGNGSIFAPFKIWRPRRKVLAPTFSLKNLNQFVEVFSQQSSIMVNQLKEAADKGTFSVWKYLASYTMDSVCETALGVKVGGQLHPENPFLKAFDEHLHLAATRVVQPPAVQKLHTFLPAFKLHMKYIHLIWEFVDTIITNKRNEIVEKEKTKLTNDDDSKEKPSQKSFLDLFIESSGGASGFTDLELREEALVLLLAGTDTSAVGSSFTCLMLARHPEIQEKVYEEIKEVLCDTNGPITVADLPRLKYLDAVIKESMRLYPPVPVIVRKVDADFQLPSGVTVLKDTSIMINIWGIHRNPAYWGDDAEQFKPERFLGSAQIHPGAYLPFSYGPRSCLGYQYAMMSMKTAMANIIRHYRFHPATPVLDKNEPLRVKYSFMMKHADNYEIQMEARL